MTYWQGLFSSQRLNWRTPKALYEELDKEFDFDFDPCPAKPKFNGLTIEWGERNFVNPPYGREIIKWIEKAIEEHQKGKLIVFLVAARTDTKWFHRILPYIDEIRFIKGRLKFDGFSTGATFPSILLILRCEINAQKEGSQHES